MKRRISTFLVLTLILGLILPMACTPKAQEKKSGMGNTNANMVNMGFSVTEGDWIYFLHQQDEGSLFKMKKDGTEESMISPDGATFLNMAEGYIYYVNAKENNKIFRIRPDGTERSLIVDSSSSHLMSNGSQLFYIDTTTADSVPAMKLYRSKLDGSDRSLITETKASLYNLVGDTIYYVGVLDQVLHRIKTDGTGDQPLGNVKPGTFNVVGDMIYYVNDPEGAKEIWSMKTDGTGSVRLSEDQATTMNVSGGWIYYGHPKDEMMSFEFKKMKLDGSEPSLVNDDQPMILNIHDDLLAYLQMDLSTFALKEIFVKADGTNRKEFSISPSGSEAGAGSESGFEILQMGEKVKTSDFGAQVNSVYSPNWNQSPDQPNVDYDFDQIDTRTYLFINFKVTNDGPTALELYQRVGIIESDDDSETYVWASLADITDRKAEINKSNYLARSEYGNSLLIKPGETRMIQAAGSLEGIHSGGILFGIFDTKEKPQAAFNIRVGEFIPLDKARDKVEQFNPQQMEMAALPPITATLDGIDHVFYPFEYQEKGQDKAYLLVDQATLFVYRGILTDGQLTPTEPVRELP